MESADVGQQEPITIGEASAGAGPTSRVTFEPLGDRVRVHITPLLDGSDAPVFLGNVAPKAPDEIVVVTLYQRNGSHMLVRQVNPCDIDPKPVEIFDGDGIQLVEAISHVGLHTNSEVESVDGFMFEMRVVPDRVEGTTVCARSLRRGENDDGRRGAVVGCTRSLAQT